MVDEFRAWTLSYQGIRLISYPSDKLILSYPGLSNHLPRSYSMSIEQIVIFPAAPLD